MNKDMKDEKLTPINSKTQKHERAKENKNENGKSNENLKRDFNGN